MIFLYAFLTIALLSGATGVGWVLRGRRARRERAGAEQLAARVLARCEEDVRRLSVELGRARSACDGHALALEDEGEARERLANELAAGRATELALRGELAARAASLELARGIAREAEEVRDAQAVELTALRAAGAVAEQHGSTPRADEERRRLEQVAAAGELAQLRSETVRVRLEAAELRHERERQAEALAEAARALARRELELAELSARLERTASEVVAADERAHRLVAENEALREGTLPTTEVRFVPDPESEPQVLPEPRARRTRVIVQSAGQGDLWAE